MAKRKNHSLFRDGMVVKYSGPGSHHNNSPGSRGKDAVSWTVVNHFADIESKFIGPTHKLIEVLRQIESIQNVVFTVDGDVPVYSYVHTRLDPFVHAQSRLRERTEEDHVVFKYTALTVPITEITVKLSHRGRRLLNAADRGIIWNIKADQPADFHRTINFYITALETGSVDVGMIRAIEKIEGPQYDTLRQAATWYSLQSYEKNGKLINTNFQWDRPRKQRQRYIDDLQQIINSNGSIV